MKKYFFAFALLISFAQLKAQLPAPLPVDELLESAFKDAVSQNKNVFVIFHASWCVWCHKMDTSMNDQSCKKFFDDNYVIRHVVVDESENKKNLENPGGQQLLEKYNGRDSGIPYWLVFDKTGKLISDSKIRKPGEGPELGQNTGCPASAEEVEFFISVLKKTSRLNETQLEIIRKRFRKNDID